jgi:hypothetical protein
MVGNPLGKRKFKNPRAWENNIKMDLMEVNISKLRIEGEWYCLRIASNAWLWYWQCRICWFY